MMEKTNKANPPRTIIVIAAADCAALCRLYQIGNFIRYLCTCITSHILMIHCQAGFIINKLTINISRQYNGPKNEMYEERNSCWPRRKALTALKAHFYF